MLFLTYESYYSVMILYPVEKFNLVENLIIFFVEGVFPLRILLKAFV